MDRIKIMSEDLSNKIAAGEVVERIANVIKETGKQTLVLAHNKTLAGQLYSELKELFPNNRVEYFVS